MEPMGGSVGMMGLVLFCKSGFLCCLGEVPNLLGVGSTVERWRDFDKMPLINPS